MKIGSLIAQMRLYRGITQQVLADKMGLTKQRISAIESADDVSFEIIRRVCYALNFEIMAFPFETRPEKTDLDIILTEKI